MKINSIYYRIDPFSGGIICEPCVILEDKSEKSCLIEYQMYLKDSPPMLKRSVVRKRNIKYYRDIEESERNQNASWKKYNYHD